MDEHQRERIALFRFGAIAELVSGPLAPGEKERLLGRLTQKAWSIPGTSRTTVGRATLRDWAAAYQAMGIEGLKPRPRTDAGTSRAIPEAVVEQLLAMRKERPKASLESLVRAMRLSGAVPADLRLAPSTVHRVLAAHGAPVTAPGTAEPDARAFTFPHANDLWTSDVMHGPRLLVPGRRDGGKTYLIAFLDDATRMVPFAAFYAAESAACFQDALKQAILRRGVPRRLYTDNGSTYRTHHLELICATLCVALVHSRPHHPRGRGKIERFFRTARSAFLPHITPEMLTSLATLNRVFWAWLEAEYHHTVHGGLDGKTPLDRFLADAALTRAPPDDLDALMRMRVQRKIGRDRTLRLDRRLYEAPDGFSGETVEVRYDPYDPAQPVHVVRKGDPTEILVRRLDLHANAHIPRRRAEAAPCPLDPRRARRAHRLRQPSRHGRAPSPTRPPAQPPVLIPTCAVGGRMQPPTASRVPARRMSQRFPRRNSAGGNTPHQLRTPRQQPAPPPWHRQHPLPHRHPRKQLLHPRHRRLRSPPPRTRRAEPPALARKRHQPVVRAALAPEPREPHRRVAAPQVPLHLPAHPARQRPLPQPSPQRRVPLPHHRVQHVRMAPAHLHRHPGWPR